MTTSSRWARACRRGCADGRDMVERSQMTPEQRKAEEWMREHDLTGVAPSWLYAHIGVGTP
jgi:hypothetical protein